MNNIDNQTFFPQYLFFSKIIDLEKIGTPPFFWTFWKLNSPFLYKGLQLYFSVFKLRK